MEKIQTGCKDLDKILKGGFPSNQFILLIGDPGSLKRFAAFKFLKQSLTGKKKAFVAFANKSKQELIDEINDFFILNYGFEKLITWVDTTGFSQGKNVLNVDLKSLFTVSIALKNFAKEIEGNKVGLLDFISPALMRSELKEVLVLLTDLKKFFLQNNLTAIVLIEKNMHSLQTLTALESLADVVIDFKEVGKGLSLQQAIEIKKFPGLLLKQKVFELKIIGNELSLRNV